jgi:ribosomal protein S18 acetylase RimI-like enzyme
MSAITRSLDQAPSHLRPFDVSKDLNAVADLVEACFADTLDEDGRRYLNHMHAAARNPGYLRWALSVAENAPMPFSGYVWVENGYLAGNLSLIPYKYQGKRCYLIANVAVDPAFRRKGIARALTNAAIDHAHKRGTAEIWLHVREENIAAQNLYQEIGFRERARRTTWEIKPGFKKNDLPPAPQVPTGIAIAQPARDDWEKYRRWSQYIYPPRYTWHQPYHLAALRPGIIGSITRLLTASQIQQWAAKEHGHLLGVLAWQPHYKHADHLWLAAPLGEEDRAISALFSQARQKLAHRRRMLLDYPANNGNQAFQEAGLRLQQTLIWMLLS